jgi:hypothetical protein
MSRVLENDWNQSRNPHDDRQLGAVGHHDSCSFQLWTETYGFDIAAAREAQNERTMSNNGLLGCELNPADGLTKVSANDALLVLWKLAALIILWNSVQLEVIESGDTWIRRVDLIKRMR